MSRNAERMIRDRVRAIRSLSSLSDALIVDLVRRAGFRATTESSGGPRGRSHISDPTGNNVVRKLSGGVPDPVYDAMVDIAITLNDMASMAQYIDDKVRFIVGAQDRVKESTVIHCLACQREVAGTSKDRVRSGYCQSCYAAWTRQGRPYRAAFELTRRDSQETQGNNKPAQKA